MPRAAPMQVGFTGGELSPKMAGRVDQKAYGIGCYKLENFIADIAGPAVKRGGTQYIAPVKTAANRVWLVRFERSASDSFVLEFGDQYIRFYQNRAQLTVGAVAAYNGATNYVPGDLVLQGGVKYYCRAATVGNAPPNATYWAPLTGDIYEVPSPWALADLTNDAGGFAISYVQSGDIIWLAHRKYPTQMLSRYANTDWTITPYEPRGGPFQDTNISAITVYSDVNTGACTLTASAALFNANMIGSLFYLEQQTVSATKQWEVGKVVVANDIRRSEGRNYKAVANGTTGSVRPTHTEGTVYDGDAGVQWTYLDAGYGWVKITGYTSPTVVTGTVMSRIPDGAVGAGNASIKWAKGMWDYTDGFADAVTFYLDRLVLARDRTVCMTVAGDYQDMQARDAGKQTTESAIVLPIPSRRGNRLLWLETLEAGLVVGTGADEWIVAPASRNEPLGPLNISANPLGAVGSRAVTPLRLPDSIVHVQRSGKKLRDERYEQGVGGVRADLNAYADHVTSGFVSIVHTAEPYSLIWGVGSDGKLAAATYYPEQEVLAWGRHPCSGFVECAATIPSSDGKADDLWLSVKRTINGAVVRYIECMKQPLDKDAAQEDSFYVDCGATYSGAAATVIGGFGHLIGETINLLVDGATHPQRLVNGAGQVTLQVAGEKVHGGQPYTATVATMDIEAGAGNGTSQGKMKRVHRGIIRLDRTLSGDAGPDLLELDTLQFRDASVPMGSPPPLFTGDMEVPWPGGSEKVARMWFVHSDPTPATVVAFMPQMATEDN